MELREKVAQSAHRSPACTCSKTPPEKSSTSAKRNSLRSRVSSYFLESHWQDAKTGSLVREIADVDYIVVDNRERSPGARK